MVDARQRGATGAVVRCLAEVYMTILNLELWVRVQREGAIL